MSCQPSPVGFRKSRGEAYNCLSGLGWTMIPLPVYLACPYGDKEIRGPCTHTQVGNGSLFGKTECVYFHLKLPAFCVNAEDKCDVSKYVECMEPIHNATFGHPHGLFQDSNDLAQSCPIIKNGIACIKKYAQDCGTEMIAENYHDQFEKPAEFLIKICDSSSPLRTEYLRATPCLTESSEDLEICSTKVQEFLAFYETDTNEKELTMTCMYEMMLRACLMSTGAEKCGLETATFIRKALIYSPSLGMQTCAKE